MTDALCLAVNSGSSSLKLGLFDLSNGMARDADVAIERIGQPEGRAWIEHGGRRDERTGRFENHAAALAAGFDLLGPRRIDSVRVAGHRVVHGGASFTEPVSIDDHVLGVLRQLVPIAPLHLPPALAAIEALAAQRPGLPQVACFDTAFHASLPERARRLPLPARFDEAGVRRYGFHGLSYESVLSVLGPARPSRIVIAHLGNGASLVAVKDGRALDTTMGFSPAGGIPMGTRPGDLDPGTLVYLERTFGLTADALDEIVEHESGLAGIGGTSDMRALLDRSAADGRARLAVEIFAYSVRKTIGAYAAALGGLDLLVFTGGIGEHAPAVRAEACDGLAHLGIVLDPALNAQNADTISETGARCPVRVIPADEDLTIARHAEALLRGATPTRPPI